MTARKSGDLLVRSQSPFNAEPPLKTLAASFVTPTEHFYLRSHGDVPVLDGTTWRLRLSGQGIEPVELSLGEIRERFRPRTVIATMQCAGNRRAELSAVKPVAGVQWGAGAIGTARWGGAVLADVLRASGIRTRPGLHVAFTCHDEFAHAGERSAYGISIPIGKAMTEDVLLAYEMNGAELTPDHGYPLRLVAPGYAGARSPKWLKTIEISDRPSDNPMQQLDYKLFPPHVSKENADWGRALPINELPLTSVICDPAPNSNHGRGSVHVSGYAVASGRGIARVDLSPDGGQSWTEAELDATPEQPWAWTLWRAELDLGKGRHELAVRAWDTAGQTQPARPEEVWNFKGYCCAAWHRVSIEVE